MLRHRFLLPLRSPAYRFDAAPRTVHSALTPAGDFPTPSGRALLAQGSVSTGPAGKRHHARRVESAFAPFRIRSDSLPGRGYFGIAIDRILDMPAGRKPDCAWARVMEVFVTRKRNPRKASFDPKAFLANVGEGKTIAKYRNGNVVFSQGDPADAVFYIQKGQVKLTVVSEQGKEAVIAILCPGHFFGEGCLNGHALRIATTTAMDDCLITRITKAAMIAAMHEESRFSELFMAYLLERNGRIEEDLIDQLFNSSEKRLARLLLLLANFGKEGRPQPIVGKISQETLAEMIGTTRARVSFFMNKFRKLGFIEYNGTLKVHNSLLNVVLYDKSEIEPGPPAGPNR
jgi:CRP/FNR family cyclic AMP-dependent transcriptional regulator